MNEKLELPNTIAILGGTGAMGHGFAARWARAGHAVLIGSRDVEKARAAAEAIAASVAGARVTGASNVDAAAQAEFAVVTVPFAHHESVLGAVRAPLAGKILVDVTVPLKPPRVDVVELPAGGSAARRAQELLGPDVRVVSAFHNVSARHLAGEHAIDCDVLVAGDDERAREIVVRLAAELGLRAWHAGPLANSVAGEALAAVLIHINRRYKIAGAGVRITGTPRGGSSHG